MHVSRVTNEISVQESIRNLPWQVLLADLNHVEHVWNEMEEGRLTGRQRQPLTLNETDISEHLKCNLTSFSNLISSTCSGCKASVNARGDRTGLSIAMLMFLCEATIRDIVPRKFCWLPDNWTLSGVDEIYIFIFWHFVFEYMINTLHGSFLPLYTDTFLGA